MCTKKDFQREGKKLMDFNGFMFFQIKTDGTLSLTFADVFLYNRI